MSREELNAIIESEHKYPVTVSELVYPEVEEMYLKAEKLTKSQIGSFYQKHDYQGVRNALEVLNNMNTFKTLVVDNVVMGVTTHVSPSQYDLLSLLGWNVDKLNLKADYPWSM